MLEINGPRVVPLERAHRPVSKYTSPRSGRSLVQEKIHPKLRLGAQISPTFRRATYNRLFSNKPRITKIWDGYIWNQNNAPFLAVPLLKYLISSLFQGANPLRQANTVPYCNTSQRRQTFNVLKVSKLFLFFKKV